MVVSMNQRNQEIFSSNCITPAIADDLSKLKNTQIAKIRGIKVNVAAIYLISFACELDIKAIKIAPRAGRKIIIDRTLKFNLLPPTSIYLLTK